ncbi:MAG: PIN domain-containing protein [Candidatus Cloacimonadota bacterium]|nr:PIN domain-containing protein [Candidatus Cloacimonadota bacterium]
MNPYEIRKNNIEKMKQLCVSNINTNNEILAFAEKLEKDYNFKPIDASHIAVAELSKCDYFVTCDNFVVRRAKKVQELTVKIINPINLLRKEFLDETESI